jgi:hypothetical protein
MLVSKPGKTGIGMAIVLGLLVLTAGGAVFTFGFVLFSQILG